MSEEEGPPRPSRSLAGKTAIVTGAGCQGDGIGNGRAVAILLAEDGASVVCADRELAWAERTVQMIEQDGKGRACACAADVSSAEDCKRIVDLARSTFGRVDILVNNVGVGGARGTAVEVDMEEWAKGLDVNVSSMVLMAKYAIPEMKTNEGPVRGSIVNLGSVAGLRGGTPHLLYPTSKGAVVNMTRTMAAHHAPDGIRVNCVCPGRSQPSTPSTTVSTLVYLRFIDPQTHYIRDAVHTNDVRSRDERRGPRGTQEPEPAAHRRQRMGLRQLRPLSGRGGSPLDHRHDSDGRRG